MASPKHLIRFVTVCAVASMPIAVAFASLPAEGIGGRAVAMLLVLSVVSALESFRLPKGGTSSAALLPVAVALLLWPKIEVVLPLALGFGVMRAVQPNASPMKVLFSSVQSFISLSVAGACYLLAGGLPVAFGPASSFERALRVNALPATVLLIAITLLNSLLVSGAISIASGQRFGSIWRSNNRTVLPLLSLLLPACFVVAYMVGTGGMAGAVFLGLSLIGFRFLQRQSHELQQVSQDLLELTIKAIEARDPYTSGHSRRVSEMAGAIAAGLSLPEREVQRVTLAGLLHDVGKIHEVFAPILRKPGRLTEEEWEIMKTHPAKGADLVTTVAHLRPLVPAIRNHHEFWDGTGYPDRLAGEKIPLGARIITVADTIDALSTDRPYRTGLGPAEVRAELVRCRGTQFDPRVVDVVLSAPIWGKLFPDEVVSSNPGIISMTRRPKPTGAVRAAT